MTTPGKVSVVIPCFNHGEFVREAAESVLGAGRGDFELIVVDDGSTDEGTRRETDLLCKRGVHVIQQGNKGVAAARNNAIRAAQGDYIFPLDADDRLRAEGVRRAVEVLDSSPTVGVVYGDVEFFGTRMGRWQIGPLDLERLLHWNYVPVSALFRRSVWDQNGGYDGTMPVQGLEDWDFWLGALENGWRFDYVPEVFFEYRKAEESMLTRASGYEEAIKEFVARKHGRLYRRAWASALKDRDSLLAERKSVRWTVRNLGTLLRSRVAQKFRRDVGDVSRPDGKSVG